jgi:anti-sigma regulatory factor (Ser/Thr protein kinase)
MALDQMPAIEDEERLRLLPQPAAAGLARRFVGRHLRRRQVPEQAIETALLVVSELVTNAYRHGRGEIELRVSVSGGHVRIEVIDGGQGQAPAVREHRPGEYGGWGLRIVEQLSLRWGVLDGTTHVWAELAVG